MSGQRDERARDQPCDRPPQKDAKRALGSVHTTILRQVMGISQGVFRVLHVSYVDNNPTLGTICVAMTRTALVVAVSLFAGCAAPTPPPADPAQASEAPAPAHAPSGKRAACTFGADQTCNEDPRVSAIWGHCTEHGTCECNAGFELGPSGYCRSKP